MEIFTDTEKRILEATDKSYKWIARDKDGYLCIYDERPFRDEVVFGTKVGKVDTFNKCVSDVLFKNITWKNSPIQYRDSKLLTLKEREYLKFVFRPFASRIVYVQKLSNCNGEYIRVHIYDDASMLFPNFEKGTMYKGMKPKVKYKLKELGIEYDE